MSTRKSLTAVGAKGENVTKTTTTSPTTTKEKESTAHDGDDGTATIKTTTNRSATPTTTANQLNATIKCEPDSPTQKMGNTTSSNNRVTRNSPLPLASPTLIKKEVHNNDSEITNSESEDNSSNVSSTKKAIRGRKSIKDNGKEHETTTETAKEEAETENQKATKNTNLISTKSGHENEKENKSDDKAKNEECKESKESKEGKAEHKECEKLITNEIKAKDTADLKDLKKEENKDKDMKTTTIKTNSKETHDKDSKEKSDAKEAAEESEPKQAKDCKETKDSTKEAKDSGDSKDLKDAKEAKAAARDTKDAKDSKPTATVTNRMTRHAVAQEVASKTRMTRNRQASSGATTRPETPPVSARRNRAAVNARTAAAQKRKRSVEDRSDTPVSKIIKLEPKDPDDEPNATIESTTASVNASTIDVAAVKIKQELIDSDDGGNGSTTTDASNANSSANRARTSSRWTGRKPTQQTASPTTRSTRQASKVTSPESSKSSNVQASKRRRTTGSGGGSNLRRSASSSLLKTNSATAQDDDSKDSMGSLSDDIPLGDVIKMEKLVVEHEDVDMESRKSHEDEEKLEEQTLTTLTNGVDEPLSIETEIPSTSVGDTTKAATRKIAEEKEKAETENVASSSTSKDASLSPELVSEGVSEISVKQFYKRPQFLENNLGIEEDPKLGEIVQKVTVALDDDAVATKADENEAKVDEITKVKEATTPLETDEAVLLNESFSAESLKEGELIYEESNDDGLKTPPPNDDAGDDSVNPATVVDDTPTKASAREEVVEEMETKLEDESMQGPLQMEEEEEDGDDDDMTAEESETISMDNNPSLHDDAVEDDEEQEEQTAGGKKPTSIVFDEIDELAQDGGLIDEIINEKTEKQTKSNECDNEKAKLQQNDKTVENLKEVTDESTAKEDDAKAENHIKALEKPSYEAEKQTEKSKDITSKHENPKIDDVASTVDGDAEAAIIKLENDSQLPAEREPEIKVLAKTENTERITVIETFPEAPTQVESMDSDEILNVKVIESSKKVEPDEVEKPIVEKEEGTSCPTTPKKEEEQSSTAMDTDETPKKSNSNNNANNKDEDNISVKSSQSTATNSTEQETHYAHDDEERLRQKEQHLQNLGLLTHKAAEKRRQDIIQTAAAVEASRAAAAVNHHHGKRNGSKSNTTAAASASSATSHEYTGTLKTVIKLNRNSTGASTGSSTTLTASTSNGSSASSSRKSNISNVTKDSGVRRQSLKITFQKGRGRATHGGGERSSGAYSSHGADTAAHGEDAYYTIQNENEGAHKYTGGSSLATATAGTKDQHLRIQKQQNNNNNNNINNNYNNYNNNSNSSNLRNTSIVQTHGRKSYNSRSNTTLAYNYNHHHATHIDSSHSEGHANDGHHHHHHGHGSTAITSHKKDDREEILIPEKASSFKFHPGRLCEDQCYYCSGKFGLYDTPCHVGQIKSVERQLKILKNEEKLTVDNCLCDACFRHVDRRANVPSYKKRLSASGHLEPAKTSSTTTTTDRGNVEDAGNASSAVAANSSDDANATASDVVRKCVVPDCPANAAHSLRRKCIRKSVKKFLLNFDMPTGSPYIWLCQSHYDAVVQCSGCVLCKRRLGKNHMYHITSDTERLEKALTDMGIPVQLGIGTAVCKLCRYFANLLMKPPDSTKSQKAEFVKNYRKRLLQFHNINDVSNEASEAEDDENAASTSKAAKRAKKEQRKTAGSPTASSSSSMLCANENANDGGSNLNEQTQADQEEAELMDFVEGETSNEHSKSPTPPGSAQKETKQSSRLKAILQNGGKSKNSTDLPSALLRSNPNLSMRELFPGEEDLGLNFKAPFGSSNSLRTPEGWTRVQTFLQYDEPTRRLWEELQKPYGNQSSFLRHLILLEKYYRNGDLVLSANASSNASVYTQTVRQRLTSYDQGHCGGLDAVLPGVETPKIVTPVKEPKAKEQEKETAIPLVEINDDDEDDVDETKVAEKSSGKAKDNDDDVIIQETTPPPSSADAKTAPKRRSRSISVDKLTQQLSSNAVTIIARPKDATQQQNQLSTSSSGKSGSDTLTPKRSDQPKLQTPPNSGGKLQTNISTLAPLSGITAIPGSIASSNNSNSCGNSRSILKSNLLGMAGNKSVEILPISSQKANSSVVTATTVTIPTAPNVDSMSGSSASASSKQQRILEVANKLLDTQQQQHNPLLTSPPELVSLQRRSTGGSGNGTNVNATATSSSISVSTSSSASSTTASLINAKRAHLMPNRLAAKPPPNVVILPDTLNAHERAESKSWRPTLMSVEENQHLLNKNGPLYQTADGRRLPGLVQVQSGGKPFLISIFDYNRMCILRREKLLRDQMLKAGKHSKSQHHQQHQQQRNSGPHSQVNFNKMGSSSSGSSNNIATANNNNNSNSANNAVSAAAKQAQAAAAQQQLMQIMQFHNRQQQHHQHQQQHQAAMKNAAGVGSSNRYLNIAPKPPLIPTSSSLMSGGVNTNTANTMNSRLGSVANQASNFPMPLLANALTSAAAAAAASSNAASLNSTPWLWSNFPDAHELLRNGTGAGVGVGSSKLPPLLPKPTTSAPATITSKQLQQQQQQLLMDNNLMSKIPKSLTVIPQQKLMGNNANNAAGGSKE